MYKFNYRTIFIINKLKERLIIYQVLQSNYKSNHKAINTKFEINYKIEVILVQYTHGMQSVIGQSLSRLVLYNR